MAQILDKIDKLTILVVEDNQGDFVLIENHLLEKFNHPEITHCSKFSEAEAYLKSSRDTISVILLDLNLPDLGGIDLIEKTLDLSGDIPVIVLTGYSDLELSEKSLQLGVYDYLVKDDITPAILHKTIIFTFNRNSFINQLAEERRNYENLFDFNPQPTWLVDLNSFKIVQANIAAQKKYGFKLDDFQKMKFTQLHPTEEENQIKDKFENSLSKKLKTHFTHYLSNGEEIKVDIQVGVIKNTTESQVIVQSNDISENLKHINTIEVQNSKLRNIAWTQSHDLRAPISRVLGIIEMIEEQPDNHEKITYWVEKLKASTHEIEDISQRVIGETKHMK